MYERRSRLPSHLQGELLKMFVVGATARAGAEVVGVHRNPPPATKLQLDPYWLFQSHILDLFLIIKGQDTHA